MSDEVIFKEPRARTGDSQDVADDSYTPHVSGVTDGFIVDHLWSHKLRSSKQNLQGSCIFWGNDETEITVGSL